MINYLFLTMEHGDGTEHFIFFEIYGKFGERK